MTQCNLESWTIDTGVEPTIRVGTILPADGMESVTLSVPEQPYDVFLDDATGPVVRARSLEVAVADGGVVLKQAADTPLKAGLLAGVKSRRIVVQ